MPPARNGYWLFKASFFFFFLIIIIIIVLPFSNIKHVFLGDSNYSSVCIASSSSSSKCCCCIETMVSKVGSRAWVMCFFFK